MSLAIKNKNDILKALDENADQLRSFGVLRLGLFGSFISGKQNEASDIDLLVEFNPSKKTFDNFMALSFFLEDLLGRKVEVITKESLSPYIGPRILNEIEYVTIAA